MGLAVDALRWLYAAFFVAMGGLVLASVLFGTGGPPPQPSPAAQAFVDALSASGFIDPLLGLGYLAGGAATFRRTTAPLGLALLSPIATIIIAYHVSLSGLWPVALVLAAAHATLLWHFRHRFTCLWSVSSQGVVR